jgi:molybdenum cofactor synthesis domain-containing protein
MVSINRYELKMNQTVELICIGNELLIGKTLNTNAQWLAKRITDLGLTISRITVVSDKINEISIVITEAIKRKPRFIITTGGLGPTFDDMTLQGIATALKLKLKVNQEALNMVKKKYQAYSLENMKEPIELTPHRLKMAKFPEGANPLPNPVGTAPAAFITFENSTIFALPGVPSEMKSIFDESIALTFKKIAKEITFFGKSIESMGIMESSIAPLIDKVMKNNPRVYIKSHPKGTEKVPLIEFHISTKAQKTNEAKKDVTKALIELTDFIEKNGGKIINQKPKT